MYVGIANGDLGWAFTTLGSALPLLQAGRLKLIAIAAPQRSQARPDVPTLAEAGAPSMMVGAWIGILAPRGTPPEVVRKINVDVNRALADPDIVVQLNSFGFETAPETPEQMGEEICADVKKFAELVKRTGATAE